MSELRTTGQVAALLGVSTPCARRALVALGHKALRAGGSLVWMLSGEHVRDLVAHVHTLKGDAATHGEG